MNQAVAKAAKLALMGFDVDGILTDGIQIEIIGDGRTRALYLRAQGNWQAAMSAYLA